MHEIYYTSSDGTSSIYAYIWEPEGSEVKGIIQIVHGFSEHALRYRDFAGFMASRGYVVCCHDQLGHGKSANGRFGYIGKKGHKLLAKDVYKLTSIMKQNYAKPIILLGLGCGSLVSRYVTSLWGIEYDGAIFSGTMGGGHSINFLYRMFATASLKNGHKEAAWVNKYLVKRNNKSFRNSEHGDSWLTRDKTEDIAFAHDPLCGFNLTYGACVDLLKLARITNSHGWPVRMPKNLPIYLFSGLNDPMGDFGRGVIKVYGELVNAGCTNIEIKLYEDARHEMLFELNRYEVYEDILKWIGDLVSHE